MAAFESTPGERLFNMPQPVAIGELSLMCTVADGTRLPFHIAVGEHASSGRTQDDALLGLPPAMRRTIRASL